MTHFEIVKKLIGSIDPEKEYSYYEPDISASHNLSLYEDLIDAIIEDVINYATKYEGCEDTNVKYFNGKARDILFSIQGQIEEYFKEYPPKYIKK